MPTIYAEQPRLATPSSKSRRQVPDKVSERRYRPSAEARVIFFRSMATMVHAGLNIDKSLSLLGEQMEDEDMADVCNLLAEKVRSGHYLSGAMAACTGAFTKIQMRLVTIGEQSGRLSDTLPQLAFYEEKRRALMMKVKGAITYPMFTLAFAFLILILLPPYLMEGIFQMVTTSGQELPWITKVVMTACAVLRNPAFYVVMVAAAAAGFVVVPKLWEKHEVRLRVFRVLMEIPVVGKLVVILASARFARALAIQLDVGITPLVALSLSADASENPILEEEGPKFVSSLKDGMTMEESLKQSEVFPDMLLQMVRAGEESASLPDLLSRVADIFEVELDNAIDIFTALLEPMVMVLMGIIVGILVISSMLPMLNILQSF